MATINKAISRKFTVTQLAVANDIGSRYHDYYFNY
jgi:hypothetical protein